MKYKEKLAKRSSIRLPDYDYSREGFYFVTVCTHKKACLLGEIVEGKMVLNEYGRIAEVCWIAIPKHFLGVRIEDFVIMPNHIHGILNIAGGKYSGVERARHASPLHSAGSASFKPDSLGAVVGSFKSAVTREINQKFSTSFTIWQRGYYDRIIRNEEELFAIKKYIIENPAKWDMDNENPANPKNIN